MFQSKSGNTAKIAEAIAQSAGTTAEAVPPAYPFDKTDVLFIGGGLYAGKLSKDLSDYINTLDPKKVTTAAIFGTTGLDSKYDEIMRAALKNKGIKVADESFVCPGKFFMFFKRSHPDMKDIENARMFAKNIIEKFNSNK
jgi:flavodoxin